MTAYVHIGTMKTGTSSIQNFLYLNRSLLQKQNYYYPISIKNTGRLNDHNPFAHKFANMVKNKNDIDCIVDNFIDLKKEIVKSNKSNIIFSTENLQWLLFSEESIIKFKNFLTALNFDKIYIIVYLREVSDLFLSMCSQVVKGNISSNYIFRYPEELHKLYPVYSYKKMLYLWSTSVSKENVIVRIFDRDEFYQKDLLKDFINTIGLQWNDEFQIPVKENKTLDLIGFELLNRINELNPFMFQSRYFDIVEYFDKSCTNSSQYIQLKFQPPKEVVQSYIDYFEESNEWVRKEFFPYKERLFPKKDLTNYKENYELKEMKPEYWDKIAELIANMVSTKNQIIQNNLTQIQNLNQNIKLKEQTIKDNLTQIQLLNNQLSFQAKHGTAKSRIQDQLSYKLGQTMIVNSKSFLGYLIMPMALLSIMISHKQEQKIYQEKIKKDPSLKLPPLEDYPDYKEVSKLKNHLSYKLGQALIQANKTWYKWGYVKMWFEIGKLKRECKNKKI
ncbi:hypothetical protein QTU61_000110 [Campylobacter lari]|nr:hypothetical protein [Campylobacter lari]